MSFDAKNELDELRPEIIAQAERVRTAIAHGVQAVQEGKDAGPFVHILVEGEIHPYLGTHVGADYLSDALITAWRMYAPGRTVEEVAEQLRNRAADSAPHVSKAETEIVCGLIPHVSTFAGRIAMWDGASPEEYLELARTWMRRDRAVEDIFEAHSEETGISVYDTVRGGMLLLVLLEELILESF